MITIQRDKYFGCQFATKKYLIKHLIENISTNLDQNGNHLANVEENNRKDRDVEES